MQKFTTKLVPMGSQGTWKCIVVPFDVASVFGSRARISVQGTLNGFPFRTSLFPRGDATFFMMVNKSMQAGSGVKEGSAIRVCMEKAGTPPPLKLPAALREAFRRCPEATRIFRQMSYACRREYVEWIAAAKRAETQTRRAGKAMAMILEGRRFNL